MFFIAAALVLTTVGVFAGKAKFATYTVYAYNGTNGYQIESASFTSLPSTTTFSTSRALSITSPGGTYGVYGFDGSNYVRISSVAW